MVSLDVYFSILAVCVMVSGLALLLLSRRSVVATESSPRDAALALLAALTLCVGIVAVALAALTYAPSAIPLPVWGGVLALSAAIVRQGIPPVATRLLRHFYPGDAPLTLADHSIGRSIVDPVLIFLVGSVAFGIAFSLPNASWTLFTLPLFAALYPAAQQIAKPWIIALSLRGTSRATSDSSLRRLRGIANALARVADLPPFRLTLIPGDLGNAYVLGFGGSAWLCVGAGLLKHLPDDELSAIIAHELGHIAHRHVRQFFILSLACGTAYMFVLVAVFRLWELEQIALGALLAALGGAVFLGLLPGWVRRRQEYDADVFAARLLRDSALVARALDSLARLSGVDSTRDSLFYPSILDRRNALGDTHH